MAGKVDDLSAMFERHVRENSPRRGGERKIAIALIQDVDGDFAIVKVERGVGTKVLGWLKDEDAADEFADMVEAMASGRAQCLASAESSVMKEVFDGLQEQGRD